MEPVQTPPARPTRRSAGSSSEPLSEGGDLRGRAPDKAAEGPPYRKPKGRPPAGKKWDPETGKYVPNDEE